MWDGQKEVPIGSVERMGDPLTYRSIEIVPRGYPSVSAMLALPEFQIAHRGGSQDFPEHSLFAYTQSVLRGAGALELSLARTTDGVWFGNHDETLLRTTGDSRDPATMTWAQVQAVMIRGNLNGQSYPNQPHQRFESIMAAYGQSHVWFVDPKYEQSRNRAAFFDLLETIPGAQDRFVVKYFNTATPLAAEARRRGFKTWGYYYDVDMNADPSYVEKTVASWDILGIDYTASAANWTKIKSFGKPVIGHIVPNAAGVTTTRSRGANGIMASSIRAAVPQVDNRIAL